MSIKINNNIRANTKLLKFSELSIGDYFIWNNNNDFHNCVSVLKKMDSKSYISIGSGGINLYIGGDWWDNVTVKRLIVKEDIRIDIERFE